MIYKIMSKSIITSFEEFNKHKSVSANESDNLPPGISDPGNEVQYGKKVEPEIEIDSSKHKLKISAVDGVPTTDFSEMAILSDEAGTIYLLQFDGSQEEFDPYKNRVLTGSEYDEDGNLYDEYDYEDLSQEAVEAIANDIPGHERGEGMKDMSRKDLVKLDGESAESLLKELDDIIKTQDAKSTKPYEAMRKVVAEFIA
jgi:hypothetical protein